MSKLKLYFKLFTSTFYISAFTFGGGLVIISLLKKKFVDSLKWIEEQEMLDYIAIGQSSPGVIAVNVSILIGYKVAGIVGALITVIGTVLPPLIIISVISVFYNFFKTNLAVAATLKGMQAGIAAVIVDVVLNLGHKVLKEKSIVSLFIMIAAFVFVYFYKINVFFVLIASGIIGFIAFYFRNKKAVKK